MLFNQLAAMLGHIGFRQLQILQLSPPACLLAAVALRQVFAVWNQEVRPTLAVVSLLKGQVLRLSFQQGSPSNVKFHPLLAAAWATEGPSGLYQEARWTRHRWLLTFTRSNSETPHVLQVHLGESLMLNHLHLGDLQVHLGKGLRPHHFQKPSDLQPQHVYVLGPLHFGLATFFVPALRSRHHRWELVLLD